LIFAPPILVNALAGQGWQKLKLPIQLVLVLVLVYLCGTTIRDRRWRGPAPAFQEFNDASVEVAKFLNANTEPDAVFTMGDRAGSLGFQLDRSLVHTEGLVNSKQYLDALKAGSVHAFLRASGVDYVVYSGGPKSGGFPVPTNAVAGEECATFREPKFGNGPKVEFVVCEEDLIFSSMLRSSGAGGGLYNVWRYRPSINLDHPPLGH
jgi:hypothetical protein